MIDRIGHYSITNPATIYDEEAMTALNLAGRTAAKVNECVDAVNKIPENVTGEVQKQIDNGTFNDQIDEFAGNIREEVRNNSQVLNAAYSECVNSTNAKYNALDARVDTLVGAIQPGEGLSSGDAELIDIRNGEDGITYVSAGGAVRKQFRTVNENMKSIESRFHYSGNCIIPDEIIKGYYFYYNSGNRTDHDTIGTTPFIPCEANEDWTLYGAGHICVWNDKKQYLRGFASDEMLTFNTGADAAFITAGITAYLAYNCSLGPGAEVWPVRNDPVTIAGTAFDEKQMERAKYVDALMSGHTPIPVSWNLGGLNGSGEAIEATNYFTTEYFSVPSNIPSFMISAPVNGGLLFCVGYNADTTFHSSNGEWVQFAEIENNAAYYRVCYQAISYYQGRDLDNVHIWSNKAESGKEAYSPGFIPFTVEVNQTLESAFTDSEKFETVSCAIKLPPNYSPDGVPSKLIMLCHGSSNLGLFDGGWTDNAGYNNIVTAFNNAGYAVFDCNGYKDDEAGWNSFGAPRGLEGYRKAYDYVTRNYNVEKEFSIYGFSMGGLVAMNLVCTGMPNVKCVGLGSPVLNVKEFCYDLGMSTAAVNLAHGVATDASYNKAMLRGFDPIQNVISEDGVNVFRRTIPPVKIWFGANETGINADNQTVNKGNAPVICEAIRNAGGVAYYKEIANAAHEICYGNNEYAVNEFVYWINRFNG